MANCCFYEMRISGTKEDITSLQKEYPDLRAFGRVYMAEAWTEEHNGLVYLSVTGDCAWSVDTAFDIDNENCKLRKASRDHNLFIESYSDEIGFEFQEHYIIKFGRLEVDEEFDYVEGYKEDFDNVDEFNKEFGTDYTEEDFNNGEDSLIVKTGFPNGYIMTDYTIEDIRKEIEYSKYN